MRATFFLLYPFHHNFSADELVSGTALPDAWAHWFSRLDGPAFDVAVDHSFSFIPPVRAVLTPELFNVRRLPEDWRAVSSVQEVRRRFSTATNADSLRARYGNRALRVTRRDAAWLGQRVQLVDAKTAAAIGQPFVVQWADALLFPDHVGVLLLRVDVQGSDLDEISTLSRYLKKVEFRRRLSVDVPVLSLDDGGNTSWAAILSDLLDGIVRDETDQADQLSRSEYSATTGVNWRVAAFVPWDDPDGVDDLQRVAFHVVTGRGPSQLKNEPTDMQMARLRRGNYLDIWNSWSALHHYDNFVFVADARGPRLEEEAAAHAEIFEHEYLMIYVYVLALRTALDLLAGEIAATPAKTADAQEHVNKLYGNLIRFNTRMWFDQIGTSPIGPAVFALLGECIGLRVQHRQVFDDAQRLSAHLDARAEAYQTRIAERTEGLLQFLSLTAIPLGVYITILQPTLFKARSIAEFSSRNAWYGLGALTLVLSIAWIALRHYQRDADDEL